MNQQERGVWYVRVRGRRVTRLRRYAAAHGLRLDRLTDEVWRCEGPASVTIPESLVAQCVCVARIACTESVREATDAPPAPTPTIGQMVQVVEGPARGLVGLVTGDAGETVRLTAVLYGKGQTLTVAKTALQVIDHRPSWDRDGMPAHGSGSCAHG